MKSGTQGHIKTKKLKMRLRLPMWQVVGILESIWQFASDCADDGAIGRYSNEDIAAYMEWEGDPDELIAALVYCRWVDADDTHRLVIHDWDEHRPIGTTRRAPATQGCVGDFRNQIHCQSYRCGQAIDIAHWASVLEHFDFACAFCSRKEIHLTIEHLTPVSRGGGNEVGNIVPACRDCNFSKKDKTPLEWFMARRSP